jgi:hypothetical protein
MGLLKVQTKTSASVMNTDVPTSLFTLMDAHISAAPGTASSADTLRYAFRTPRRLYLMMVVWLVGVGEGREAR